MIRENCNHPEYAVVDHTCTHCHKDLESPFLTYVSRGVIDGSKKPITFSESNECFRPYKRKDFSHLVDA